MKDERKKYLKNVPRGYEVIFKGIKLPNVNYTSSIGFETEIDLTFDIKKYGGELKLSFLLDLNSGGEFNEFISNMLGDKETNLKTKFDCKDSIEKYFNKLIKQEFCISTFVDYSETIIDIEDIRPIEIW